MGAALAVALVAGVALMPAPARADVMRADVDAMIDAILTPWPDWQNADGTMPDWLRNRHAGGRARSYDETVLGLALLAEGVERRDERLRTSGLRALHWLIAPARRSHRRALTPFDTAFGAAAYRLALVAGFLEDRDRTRFENWLRRLRPLGGGFSNRAVVEAAGLRELGRAAVPGIVGVSRELRSFERALRRHARRFGARRGVLLSDPPANPLAYQALTAAFLVRYAALGEGPADPVMPEVRRHLDGLLAISAPDGDLAWSGRSQQLSWAPALGAYAALQAADWERRPARAQALRGLAARLLSRLRELHMRSGWLSIAPVLGGWPPPPRARGAFYPPGGAPARTIALGVDGYAGAPTYDGLTAVALQWVRAVLPAEGLRTADGFRASDGGIVGTGRSSVAMSRDRDHWIGLRRAPTVRGAVDLRADGGLVRAKVRIDRIWHDLLPAPPRLGPKESGRWAPRSCPAAAGCRSSGRGCSPAAAPARRWAAASQAARASACGSARWGAGSSPSSDPPRGPDRVGAATHAGRPGRARLRAGRARRANTRPAGVGRAPRPALPRLSRTGRPPRRGARDLAAARAVTPARRVAMTVVRRVVEDGAYADRVLLAELSRTPIDARERAFATALVYTTVQRLGTLDHLIERLAGRSLERLEPPVAAALRLGLAQLLFMDGVADHAAVSESVDLARAAGHGGGGHRLVNAILRRAATERDALLAALPEHLALSHPEWIARMFEAALGAEEARALMAADNKAAESALRANTLVSGRDELAAVLPVASRPAADLPEGLLLDEPFDAHGSPLFAAGTFMPQSRASMVVARVLDPQPGEQVLDLCAAPGAKTTHLAALMENAGEVVAVERDPGRADGLRATCERMLVTNVRVVVADAADPAPGGPFQRVLVDPPCSGLGTLRSRPDLRWRITPAAIEALVREQAAVLAAGAQALAPGGTLVYSACTISPAENEAQIDALLGARPDLRLDDLQSAHPLWEHPRRGAFLLTMPHRDGTDGFFIARLRRGG